MNTSDKQPLLVEIAEPDFRAKVLESKRPVLVEFQASWCPCCQVLDSALKEVAVALAGKAKVVKINADTCSELRFLYDIEVIPTLLYFVQGEPLVQIVGSTSREEILASLETLQHHSMDHGVKGNSSKRTPPKRRCSPRAEHSRYTQPRAPFTWNTGRALPLSFHCSRSEQCARSNEEAL